MPRVNYWQDHLSPCSWVFQQLVEQSWDLFLAYCPPLGAQSWWKVIFSFPVGKMRIVILILLSRRQRWGFVCQDASVKTGLIVIKEFVKCVALVCECWLLCSSVSPTSFENVFSSCLLWGGKRRRAILREALKIGSVANRLRCSTAHPASPRVCVQCGPQESVTSLLYL